GPAAIDFEYHYVPALMQELPARTFDAMSHHLYVDRRGAPENPQGSFALLEKLALAKALARTCKAFRSPRLVISEVNWPLAGTGCHSPVAAPYVLPTQSQWALGVDEETYADY